MLETGKITERQIRSMAFLMTMGGIFVIGGTKEAGEESYLSALLSVIPTLPLYALYEHLLTRAGQGGLFALCRQCFGALFGKIAIALFGVYAVIIGTAVAGNYLNFIHTVFLTDTAFLVVGILSAAAITFMVRCGRMAMARVSRMVQYAVIGTLSVTLVLSLFAVDLDHFPYPMLYHGLQPVAAGAFSIFTVPFGDVIILLPLLDGKSGRRGSRNLIRGAGMTWVLLTLVFLRNVLALGPASYGILFFKSFVAVRIISVGAFFQRMEILVSVIYILCDTLKLALCVQCLTKCLNELTGRSEQRENPFFAAPSALLMIGLAAVFVSNQRYITLFLQTHKYLALPFTVVLPGLLALTERLRRNSRNGQFPTGCIASSVPVSERGIRRS